MTLPEATSRRARILVVDDDAVLRQSLQEWLQWSGYDTAMAADGAEAIVMARQNAFELVVTDLVMPYLDGLALLTQLKAHDARVQVIFLSGQAKAPGIVAAQRAGLAFDALQKPLITLARLNASIERAIRHRRTLMTLVQPA